MKMLLKEMKEKVFSLIEEYEPAAAHLAEDEDIINKVNGVINSIQMDLMPYRPIPSSHTFEIDEDDSKVIDLSTVEDIYQVTRIILNDVNRKETYFTYIDEFHIKLDDDFVGTVDVYYHKIPTLCKTLFEGTEQEIEEERTQEDEEYEFEIDAVLLEVMPYGVARDLLRLDMISQYGTYFERTYNEKKQMLDSRRTRGYILIEGGDDI